MRFHSSSLVNHIKLQKPNNLQHAHALLLRKILLLCATYFAV